MLVSGTSISQHRAVCVHKIYFCCCCCFHSTTMVSGEREAGRVVGAPLMVVSYSVGWLIGSFVRSFNTRFDRLRSACTYASASFACTAMNVCLFVCNGSFAVPKGLATAISTAPRRSLPKTGTYVCIRHTRTGQTDPLLCVLHVIRLDLVCVFSACLSLRKLFVACSMI